MAEEKKRESLFSEFISYFAYTFTPTILAITAMGIFNVTNLFVFNDGLSYTTIVQITVLTLILSVFVLLLFSENFTFKLRFFWRFCLLLLAVFFTTAVFIIVFNWFPINDLSSWLTFLLFSAICFIVVILWVLIKKRLESKKINSLLKNYKARHKRGNISEDNW